MENEFDPFDHTSENNPQSASNNVNQDSLQNQTSLESSDSLISKDTRESSDSSLKPLSSSEWSDSSGRQNTYYNDDNRYDDNNRYGNSEEDSIYENPRYQNNNTSYNGQNNKMTNNTPKKGHNLAIASLVLGIISLVMIFTCCLSYICIVPAVAGIVCAILAKDELGKRENIAIAGLICSIISSVIFVIVIIFTVFIGTHYTDFYEDDNGIEYNIPFNKDDTDAL